MSRETLLELLVLLIGSIILTFVGEWLIGPWPPPGR